MQLRAIAANPVPEFSPVITGSRQLARVRKRTVSPSAVSYTHLDVYKRQRSYRTPIAKAAYQTISDVEARKRREQTGLDTLVAVSYTHLVLGKNKKEHQPFMGSTGFIYFNEADKNGIGYWIMYIDAATGRISEPYKKL